MAIGPGAQQCQRAPQSSLGEVAIISISVCRKQRLSDMCQ